MALAFTEIETAEIESKYGFYEVFTDKSNKSNFNSIFTHSIKKKYKGKIAFPIIETLIVDNGQISYWIFTDKSGFVVKKSSKKLTKDFILIHFIKIIISHLKNQGIKLKKNENQILADINRFSVIADQKFEPKIVFADKEFKYLEDFNSLKFILTYYSNNLYFTPRNMINIFEFNKIINDVNKINGVLLFQNYIDVNHNLKPLVLKYTRKSLIGPKKFQIFTEKPINNLNYKNEKQLISLRTKSTNTAQNTHTNFANAGSNMKQLTMESEEEDRSSKSELLILNDFNMLNYMENLIEPFIKLIEKVKKILITEANFKFIKVKEFDNKEEHYLFTYCTKVVGKSKQSENYIEYDQNLKSSMLKIREKTIPRDLRIRKISEGPLLDLKDKKTSTSPGKNHTEGGFHIYEKITKNSFCFGEFCDYSIPKFFKNLKKNNKADDINSNIIPNENKFTTRDKNYKLPYSLPVFIIKKAYDNPHLVNIVLKAYSIFPMDFDKDLALREIYKIKRQEEEKRKEQERQKELKTKLKENLITTIGTNSKLPSINDQNIKIVEEGSGFINLNSGENESAPVSLRKPAPSGSGTLVSNETSRPHHLQEKSVVTLYTPTPKKFDHINHDNIYSRKHVCNNCYTIYTLVQNFLCNIDETTSQFISLSKAKDLLLQGDNLKNPNQNDESFNQEQPVNLLFQEENKDFNLKDILQKNINKVKREQQKKKERKKK